MKIKTPKERAYYLASKNEKDRLLCWIPAEEYQHMVREGYIPRHILDDYPDGLEVEVSKPGFNEFQLNVGVSPEAIKEAHKDLLTLGLLPDSGIVDGASLERFTQETRRSGSKTPDKPDVPEFVYSIEQKLPEPKMTDGEDAMIFMQKLE